MQLLSVELKNNITGQSFSYTVQVVNWTQFYNRLSVLMTQLAIIENVAPENISHTITNKAALLAA